MTYQLPLFNPAPIEPLPMTSPAPDTMASPTRKRLREEEASVKKLVLNSPKRRITKLGNHSQVRIPKFALSTGGLAPPGLDSSSQGSPISIPPPVLTHPGPSSPQTNSSTNTPSKRHPVSYNHYARASTSYEPFHQSPWHEFKYAKHNPTEPSSILYFEKQRQIARTEADDRARIAGKKRIETEVAIAAAATLPSHSTETPTRMRKAVTPAPARRIHDPCIFMSERKPTGKLPARQGFTFGGNHPDARSCHPVAFNPVISRHSTPTRARDAISAMTPSTQKDSRMANFTATAVAGAARFYVEADSIVNSLSRSYSLAKAALVGNRDSKIAERKESQKVAIRKRIEEEERVRRKELFEEFEKFEAEHEQRNREHIKAIGETSDQGGGHAAGCTEGPNWHMAIHHDVELPTECDLEFSGANGDPSFATEDTILDTVVTESAQVLESAVIMSSPPVARADIHSDQSSPIPAPVVYTNFPITTVDNHEESSSASSPFEGDSDDMEIIEPPKQLQQVINLDSDDEVDEMVSSGFVPQVLFYFIFEE